MLPYSLQGLATRWLASLPGRDSHPLDYTTLPGRTFTQTGAVTLEVRPEPRADREDRLGLHIRVIDTGIGIDDEQMERIFQGFEQGDGSHARQYGGVGLGLSICTQLVGLMGGQLWAESQQQQGSTFHVTLALPRAEQPPPTAADNATADNTHLPTGLRILVVDDNEVNRDVAGMILAEEHRVRTAADGMEALQLLAVEAFDLVLMDVQMPLMDGLSASATIREMETEGRATLALPAALATGLAQRLRGGHLPIVAMTAHAMAGDEERCRAAGMDGYLTKPFQPEQLQTVLRETFPSLLRPAAPERPAPQPSPSLVPEPSIPDMVTVRNHLQATTLLKPEQIDRIVQAALRSIIEHLDAMGSALERGDQESLGRAAHTLKGTLLQCGLERWAHQAQAIHSGLRQHQDLPYAELVEALRQAMRPILEEQQQR